MAWRHELAAARERWNLLTFYEKFEHAVIVVLTGVIALIIVFALWSLVLKVVVSILESSFDPTDYSVFQALFGMIFTVIIALEFKRSLLVVAERKQSIVQVRTVILLALLAVVRKIMIVDLASTDALQLLALAATILALGVAYWLVTYRERAPRIREP
ncbi:phosphate-starvation-inducible PsiE family protein [Pseudorhodoplanes sp.]|uniref:phosphate-starvation-inducible PsiE family protein n=1 Tax=Pseudorhodoplanes sp. TaxID=1934341 RepID=UPI003D1414D2